MRALALIAATFQLSLRAVDPYWWEENHCEAEISVKKTAGRSLGIDSMAIAPPQHLQPGV